MDRLEMVRQVVDEILRQQPDEEERRCGFVHLYGVATVCALLAIKRGLDAQLCAVAGVLHDIWSYKTGNPTDHARLSAVEAENILAELGCFTPEEIAVVRGAIARHGSKEPYDGEVDELLKDADVLQQYLYNPALVVRSRGSSQVFPVKSAAWALRVKGVFGELGLGQSAVVHEQKAH